MGGEITVTSELGKGFDIFIFPACGRGIGEDSPEAGWPKIASGGLALICAQGAASVAALSDYFAAAGLLPRSVAAEELRDDAGKARIIVAEVGVLEATGARIAPAATPVIALARLGETGIESLQSRGLADIAFEMPMSRADVLRFLVALREGTDLRATVDERRTNSAATQYPSARVLVVDDGAVNREVAQEALRRFGIAAELVCDGQDAVAACAERDFDLVLMDGSMPGLDGFDATRAIRAAEKLRGARRLPIVAMTAHVVGRAADAWREAGMDGVLHKPFTIAAMGECLARFLQSDQAPVLRLSLLAMLPTRFPCLTLL